MVNSIVKDRGWNGDTPDRAEGAHECPGCCCGRDLAGWKGSEERWNHRIIDHAVAETEEDLVTHPGGDGRVFFKESEETTAEGHENESQVVKCSVFSCDRDDNARDGCSWGDGCGRWEELNTCSGR